jgi:hypothetical protein
MKLGNGRRAKLQLDLCFLDILMTFELFFFNATPRCADRHRARHLARVVNSYIFARKIDMDLPGFPFYLFKICSLSLVRVPSATHLFWSQRITLEEPNNFRYPENHICAWFHDVISLPLRPRSAPYILFFFFLSWLKKQSPDRVTVFRPCGLWNYCYTIPLAIDKM